MADIKVTLQKKVGPFKLWQWLVVAIVGIGMGLVIRKRLGQGQVDTHPETLYTGEPVEGLEATQGSVGQTGQLIDWGSGPALIDEQNRFLDELDKQLDDLFATVKDKTEKVTVPVYKGDGPGDGGPGDKGGLGNLGLVPMPKVVDDLASYRTAVINAYRAEGVREPNPPKVESLALQVKKGRKIAALRKDIRKNEAKQGRKTIAESRAYHGV
jgi:hypothetical protein